LTTVQAEPHRHQGDEQEQIVREMERILVAAAFDPACPTGITASAALSSGRR
jgi:hypothetical protein